MHIIFAQNRRPNLPLATMQNEAGELNGSPAQRRRTFWLYSPVLWAHYVKISDREESVDELPSIVLIVGAIVLGLFLVGLALAIIAGAIATAASLFGWAAESGFIGVAVYVILWVIATPFMFVICLVGGVFRALGWWLEERDERRASRNAGRDERRASRNAERKAAEQAAKGPHPGEPGYLDWANRTGPYAD